MAILTTVMRNPTGYGRILRQKGRIVAIVEQKDATEGRKADREVNTGIMLLPTARLSGWLSELKASNAQGEYYLTDVIGLAVRDGVRINSARPAAVLRLRASTQKRSSLVWKAYGRIIKLKCLQSKALRCLIPRV